MSQARRKNPEEVLQRHVANYLRLALPEGCGVPWTAVEAAGRGGRDGARQKAKGVRPGFPDLQFILPPHGRFLGIELKAGAPQSKSQQAREAEIATAGGFYHIARSVREVDSILREHGVEPKVRGL